VEDIERPSGMIKLADENIHGNFDKMEEDKAHANYE